MIDQPTHYMTEEAGEWIPFPINLFEVSERDLEIAPPEEGYQRSKVIWLESNVFPGMFLKVYALKWNAGNRWDTHDCTVSVLYGVQT